MSTWSRQLRPPLVEFLCRETRFEIGSDGVIMVISAKFDYLYAKIKTND
jgi:hypothetical protein